jgi:hypothetical protein
VQDVYPPTEMKLMAPIKLTKQQRDIIRDNKRVKVWLEGSAGTGKTTVGVQRLEHLLKTKTNANTITVMLPQLTLATPYREMLDAPSLPAGGQVHITTLGGIARRAVSLFWSLLADKSPFARPDSPPVFLSLETAQYFMARVVGAEIDKQGYFDTITVERARIYSQIMDNLNKAALIDSFDYSQIGERLTSAWTGDHEQVRMYDDAQACAVLFRQYCYDNNLLDFSLQIETFKQLWLNPIVKKWLFEQCRYVIADNVEEDNPFGHKILAEIIEQAQGVLIIYDSNAGYRQFLGSDAINAVDTLKPLCKKENQIKFEQTFVQNDLMQSFAEVMDATLKQSIAPPKVETNIREAFIFETFRYYPEMIDGVVAQVSDLIHHEDVKPSDIVIVSPYMSDALRFSLLQGLKEHGIPALSHRPSRSLRQEPATQTLLTLAQLAHPQWNIRPTPFDVAYMFQQAIADVDLVRAQLLARQVYHIDKNRPILSPFATVKPELQERITFGIGERYEHLRGWLANYQEAEPLELDHFLSRLFGEVLSQWGYGFHLYDEDWRDLDASTVTSSLIQSAQKFRQMIKEADAYPTDKTLAQEYIEMVNDGVIADQYISNWQAAHEQDAVLVAPAYTYLMGNRAVDYQFWLNVNGAGWAERILQPLTNPYVLSLHWPYGRKWTDVDETRVAQESLHRLIMGLLNRCRKGVYLTFSELSEQGYEQNGLLVQAFQKVLRSLA